MHSLSYIRAIIIFLHYLVELKSSRNGYAQLAWMSNYPSSHRSRDRDRERERRRSRERSDRKRRSRSRDRRKSRSPERKSHRHRSRSRDRDRNRDKDRDRERSSKDKGEEFKRVLVGCTCCHSLLTRGRPKDCFLML